MKLKDNIERAIRQLRRSTRAETDQRILDDAIGALAESTQSKSTGPVSTWRIVISSRVTQLVVVAVIAFVVFVGLQVSRKPKKALTEVSKPEIRIATRGAQEAVVTKAPRKITPGVEADKTKADSAPLAKSKLAGETERAASLSKAERAAPDRKEIEVEAKQIQEMVAAGNIDGLIEMLSVGGFASKVAAAESLGEIADDRALPVLKKLNREHGGWMLRRKDYDSSGIFAWSIWKILSRDLSENEVIEGWFDLLEGRGPAVPEGIGQENVNNNFDVGRGVGAELEKYDDPAIVQRLRTTGNKAAAVSGVWMEVRDMAVEEAIDRCVEIAEDEGGAQRYGATHCLGRFAGEAIDALDELAGEGHAEAIAVLGKNKQDHEVLELICWHLTNNKNSLVRFYAVGQLYGEETFRPEVVPALIEALYDPVKSIRRNGAQWLLYAAHHKKTPHLKELEEAMLIGLKHPDQEVREYAAKALKSLGSQRTSDQVPEPPGFRTDLEVASREPLTAEQRLKAKSEPLEQQAGRALQMGPGEEAVELYEQLLELRPGHEPYIAALKKANAYVEAAGATGERWYPDAPYIGLKGRYSYLLASEPNDMSTLKEEFDLALYLEREHFEDWSDIIGNSPKGGDQFEKALKLYEHIVEHYFEYEYYAIGAKVATARLYLNLDENIEAYVSQYIDIFAIPTENVVDSTDQKRNRPLEAEEAGGKSQAQSDFESLIKDFERERIIQLSSIPGRGELHSLLDRIIERCADTDPNIVDMAEAAKLKIQQYESAETELEEAAEQGE